jgi:DNA anti-recombination protein RmuC
MHAVALLLCRCALLEQQCQQLQQQLIESASQLERLQQQQGQLQRECDKRIAAVKASAAADKDALSARNAAKIKKLQEAAKDQVRCGYWTLVCDSSASFAPNAI